ncbi:MAG: 3-dehydroquinate synthase, partial [Chthoniobacterales bacterium]|nr:3-dehydroquinate synthase [Chthoniobacterales bacterium]
MHTNPAAMPVESVPLLIGMKTYEAVIGSNLLATIGARVSALVRGPQCAVVADSNTAALFAASVRQSLEAAGFQPLAITIRPGEKSKSLEQVGALCEQMSAAGFDRTSFVVALGGGVVGDLAGFAAAIYHRGIPYVQVPTTLLAQVDSSIGGKTAVNTPAGKNLLGAVHQPALVVADLDTLRTLPPRELNQGFAEIIKHAIIADPSLLDLLRDFDGRNFAALVRRNIEIKAAIVARDEHDSSGERAILNFGHTVGHAIERACGYGRFLHGEAVSLGMVAACEISRRTAGFADCERQQVLEALESRDLPVRLPAHFPRAKI